MKEVVGMIFVKEEQLSDIQNLLLPIDMTVFIYGSDPVERKTCEAVAKSLEVINLLLEHGIVMVIIEKGNHIRIAGGNAISDFLSVYYASRVNGLNLENVGR